jgi:hypothetical protein
MEHNAVSAASATAVECGVWPLVLAASATCFSASITACRMPDGTAASFTGSAATTPAAV